MIQALFSVGYAATFIKSVVSDEDWPRNKPDDLWNWFRAVRGALTARDKDPRWAEDVGNQATSLENIKTALEIKWGQIAEERRIAAAIKERSDAWEAAKLAVSVTLRKHIFEGDYQAGTDIPSGYHSKVGVSATHVAYGEKTVIDTNLGIYQQSVKAKSGAKKKKPIQSTFFPDAIGGRDATKDDVIFAVGTAMVSMGKFVKYPEEWRGMKLTKIGDTWFPDGGSDDLLAA